MNRKTVIKENYMFSKIFKNGRYASNYYITVYILRNYNKNAASKLGISVSPKNGCAVKRNRAKRVIREAFRILYDRLPPGYLIVVAGRKPCFERKNKMQSVLESMESAFIRLGLIKP
ncbi:MAG: ribonuclease P protein component [Oscillospiraceae bacterium]|nr:ribonuclease P protein component [Oscillospiraceae bacterium]